MSGVRDADDVRDPDGRNAPFQNVRAAAAARARAAATPTRRYGLSVFARCARPPKKSGRVSGSAEVSTADRGCAAS